MYSPKRRFRLFRHPAWAGGGDTPVYSYTWVEQTTATSTTYLKLESTRDFSTLITTRGTPVDGQEGAYLSTDEGANWTRKANGITWPAPIYATDVAIASENSNIMFIANRGTPGTDYIWRSTDKGENWSLVSPLKLWTSVSCSANGSNVVATEITTSNVWVSSDTGSNWTQITGTGNWGDSAVSSDGTVMIATVVSGSNLRISSDSGSNWSNVQFAPTTRTNYRVVCSSNARVIMVNTLNTLPRISRDFGSNWSDVTDVSTGFTTNVIAMSSNGSVIAYGGSNLPLFVSQDEGVSWQQQPDAGIRYWRSITMDGSGSKILAGVQGGRVWLGVGT